MDSTLQRILNFSFASHTLQLHVQLQLQLQFIVFGLLATVVTREPTNQQKNSSPIQARWFCIQTRSSPFFCACQKEAAQFKPNGFENVEDKD